MTTAEVNAPLSKAQLSISGGRGILANTMAALSKLVSNALHTYQIAQALVLHLCHALEAEAEPDSDRTERADLH